MALWAWSSSVLVTGICGSARTAYQPAFFSCIQRRTRSPFAAPAVVAMCSAKRRNRWPSANTRKPLRWRARCKRVWNCERNVLRTEDGIAVSFPGSLLSAWRKQLPRRTPGNSVRRLLVVLSKPSVRTPLTRYDGSCCEAACCNSPYDWVKAAALAFSVWLRCHMTRPLTIVGRHQGLASHLRAHLTIPQDEVGQDD